MNNENQLNFLFDMDYNDPNEYLLQNDQYMGMQNPYGNNNNRYLTASLRNRLLENKFTLSASFSCLRLSLLYLFYFIENYKLTPYLENLIVFLLVYESMVIANFVAMKTYLMIKRMFNPLSLEFPTLCLYIYTLNEMILFTWFIYGCYCIMIDTKGVEQSLRVNPLMMYYITVLILFGFFLFSKAIFYLIFFICFCPCIAYAYVSDLYTDYERTRQAAKVQEELVEIDYEDYSKDKAKENIESTCIICCGDFKPKEKVIVLKCNSKHVFHASCLRPWITMNPSCPTCRCNLIENAEESMNENNISNQQ